MEYNNFEKKFDAIKIPESYKMCFNEILKEYKAKHLYAANLIARDMLISLLKNIIYPAAEQIDKQSIKKLAKLTLNKRSHLLIKHNGAFLIEASQEAKHFIMHQYFATGRDKKYFEKNTLELIRIILRVARLYSDIEIKF